MICKNFYFQIMSFVIFVYSEKYLCTYFKVSHSKSHPDHHHDFLLGLLTNLNIYLVFFFSSSQIIVQEQKYDLYSCT